MARSPKIQPDPTTQEETMSEIESKLFEMIKNLQSVVQDAEKVGRKQRGGKAAAVRLRKALQSAKITAHELRRLVTESFDEGDSE
jgi:tRNA C32,U32 (ribose-2'-O)-methylase TrmJ